MWLWLCMPSGGYPPAYRCNSWIDGFFERPSEPSRPLKWVNRAAGKTPIDVATFCASRPLNGLTGRQVEDFDFAWDAFHSIDIICSGARRSGVGYQIIQSIPRSLVVVRTCRSALNMLNVCVCRGERICSVLSPLTQVVVHGRRVVSHAQPQHKSSNSALYRAMYDIMHLREPRLEFSRCVYRANEIDQCLSFRAKILG